MATTTEIIVEDVRSGRMDAGKGPKRGREPVVEWIMGRVEPWRDWRDTQYKSRWDEYYRLWRGIWSPEDKLRNSERSRIITPALQQAVEVIVADIEEAIFGRGRRWIDVEDDVNDPEKEDMAMVLKLLLEDYERDNIADQMNQVFLNAALYGTGIAKIVVEVEKVLTPFEEPILGTEEVAVMVKEGKRLAVKLVNIDPYNFVIDPAASRVDDALGCAHEYVWPRHKVEQLMSRGVWRTASLGAWNDDHRSQRSGELQNPTGQDQIWITEWHGLVPRNMLTVDPESDEYTFELFHNENVTPLKAELIGDRDLVEAIVTIANESTVVKAVENPFMMRDRCIIAYQHDTVPNRFWGRGIAEKGYNAQKALDTEWRARIDALAYSNSPMLAIEASSIPRGAEQRLAFHPGRVLLTSGNPNESIREFRLSGPDPNTYRHTSEAERMIQMGTGAMDSASPEGVSPRNQTASGMSMILAGAMKRSKRTMQNIERNFLDPFVKKSAWRYMEFYPERYPTMDLDFRVHSTMGIMAREFEQAQMTNLLQTVPPESPAYWMLLRSIYDNSSFTDKDQIVQVVDGIIENMMQPKKPEEDPQYQLEMKKLEIQERDIQIRALIEKAKIDVDVAKNDFISQIESRKVDISEGKLAVNVKDSLSKELKAESEAVFNVAKAQAARAEQLAQDAADREQKMLGAFQNTTSIVSETLNALRADNQETLSLMEGQLSMILGQLGEEINNRSQRPEQISQELQENVAPLGNALFPPQAQAPQMGQGNEDQLAAMQAEMEALKAQGQGEIPIERDERGLIRSVGGRQVKRGPDGLIAGVGGEE